MTFSHCLGSPGVLLCFHSQAWATVTRMAICMVCVLSLLAGSHVRAQGDETPDAWSTKGEGAATFALWLATGAITGTGASWTMGGTTTTGMAVGAVLGTAAGWGWLRWTSPK